MHDGGRSLVLTRLSDGSEVVRFEPKYDGESITESPLARFTPTGARRDRRALPARSGLRGGPVNTRASSSRTSCERAPSWMRRLHLPGATEPGWPASSVD